MGARKNGLVSECVYCMARTKKWLFSPAALLLPVVELLIHRSYRRAQVTFINRAQPWLRRHFSKETDPGPTPSGVELTDHVIRIILNHQFLNAVVYKGKKELEFCFPKYAYFSDFAI